MNGIGYLTNEHHNTMSLEVCFPARGIMGIFYLKCITFFCESRQYFMPSVKSGYVSDANSFERCNLQGTEIRNRNLKYVQITNRDLTGITIDHTPVKKLLEVYYCQ